MDLLKRMLWNVGISKLKKTKVWQSWSNSRLKWLKCALYLILSIGMPYYQEGCNIDCRSEKVASLWGRDLAPLVERIKIVEARKWLKETQLTGSSWKRLTPNEFLNRDVGFALVNLNFVKQILVSPFLVCLTTLYSSLTLYFRFDLLSCIVSVCAWTRNIFDITYRGTTSSCICARTWGRDNSDFVQVPHRTGRLLIYSG